MEQVWKHKHRNDLFCAYPRKQNNYKRKSFQAVSGGKVYVKESRFGGLVVTMLASGTRVRGFEPGRSRRIIRVSD